MSVLQPEMIFGKTERILETFSQLWNKPVRENRGNFLLKGYISVTVLGGEVLCWCIRFVDLQDLHLYVVSQKNLILLFFLLSSDTKVKYIRSAVYEWR